MHPDIRFRRPSTQGSSIRASGSLEAAQRPVRFAQDHYGYVGASESQASQPLFRSAQSSRADQFVAAGMAMPRDAQVRFPGFRMTIFFTALHCKA